MKLEKMSPAVSNVNSQHSTRPTLLRQSSGSSVATTIRRAQSVGSDASEGPDVGEYYDDEDEEGYGNEDDDERAEDEVEVVDLEAEREERHRGRGAMAPKGRQQRRSRSHSSTRHTNGHDDVDPRGDHDDELSTITEETESILEREHQPGKNSDRRIPKAPKDDKDPVLSPASQRDQLQSRSQFHDRERERGPAKGTVSTTSFSSSSSSSSSSSASTSSSSKHPRAIKDGTNSGQNYQGSRSQSQRQHDRKDGSSTKHHHPRSSIPVPATKDNSALSKKDGSHLSGSKALAGTTSAAAEPAPSSSSSSPSTSPDVPLDPVDWDALEARFQKIVDLKGGEEENPRREFDRLVKLFNLWITASAKRDKGRGQRRLKTRIYHVQNSEAELEKKQEHYARVVQAFENALKLLEEP